MTIDIGHWRKTSFNHLKRVSDDASIEILALLKHVLKKDTTWILTNPDRDLSENELRLLNSQLKKLIQGVPLAYITKKAEFYGIEFFIEKQVLIPRPETELMVEKALDWCNLQSKTIKMIDIGTGSGCIGLSILKHYPKIIGYGVDISLNALRIAKNNKEHLKINSFNLVQSDLLTAMGEKFDLICANLPYIPTNPLKDLQVSRFEPSLALDGGNNGLEIIYRLIDQIDKRLNQPGLVLLEIQYDQGNRVSEYVKDKYSNADVKIIKDLSGNDRVISIEIHV